MEEVFDKIKEKAYKAKDGAVKLTKNVIDKTNNVVNQTKLKFAISETENKIEDIYAEIGKVVYEKYVDTNEACCDFVAEKCGKIDALKEEAADLKEQLAQLKETVKCSACGAYNSAEDVYCSKCGAKLYNVEDDFEEDIDDSVNVVTIKARKPSGDNDTE